MTIGTIHVVRPGLQTTVQDRGRWGCQAQGVGVAGPMDPWSHRLANALVGNSQGAAMLEITLTGPELVFDDDRLVAVTGARFDLTLDGAAVPHDETFVVPAKSHLRFGARTFGARAYLAIDGGIDSPVVLNSRATHVRSAMGGWCGRALAAGDRLPLGSPRVHRHAPARHRVRVDMHSVEPGVVRVLPGPDGDRFAADALDALQSGPYTVGVDSDRMGFRLTGPPLRHVRGADLISEATPLGSLQVPADGQPVLLMADRPTTGGYPRIATVISVDVGIAGQSAPGDRLAFRVCPHTDALSALIERERRLLALEAAAS